MHVHVLLQNVCSKLEDCSQRFNRKLVMSGLDYM